MENNLTISVQMQDADTTHIQEFLFSHSAHSFERSSQRGINEDKLAVVIAFGKAYYKQGLIFYVLGDNDVPQHLDKEKKKKKNTVVVVRGDHVLTCYRNNDPHKYLKKKSNIYRTYKHAA